MENIEIPSNAYIDAVMASPSEIQQVFDWAAKVFIGTEPNQADWADAHFVMQDGSLVWLDDNQYELIFAQANEPPFSFVYDGVPSDALLRSWKRTVTTEEHEDWVEHMVHWVDPKTSLTVIAVVKVFRHYPAIDWVLYFENRGERDTPIIQDIQALDVRLATGNVRQTGILHQLHGDSCSEKTFLPFDETLGPGKTIHIAPSGGRSSSETAFPFFNFQYADRGVIAAVGWSGQWAASFKREPATSPVPLTRLQAGMELTHLSLHPGERIRSPRILLMPWKGDRMVAHNRFRRLMLFHYMPRQDGRPVRLPIALQTFDRYIGTPGWATEAGQLRAVQFAHDVGCDTYWLDAGWFPGGFPNGVGNWYHRVDDFPDGLKPISDMCHKLGMKFVLWFEPERVAPGTQIAREHPEWVFGGDRGGLFKLNDPIARRWLTDLLLERISEYGVDIYRNDFNIDPLQFWRQNDPANRQGMTEIRYIEGLYEMWDELRSRHPGLLIDNCASGGRRIDLETCMRSVPLWRSDTCCSPGHSEWNQMQSCALGMYLPLFTASAWTPEAYDLRSAATAGVLCQWGYMDESFSDELARRALLEVKEIQKYWYGDLYPLTPISTELDQIMAYQLHRPDLGEGLVLAFRRPNCSVLGLIVGLQGLEPDAIYDVELIDNAWNRREMKVSGRELLSCGLELRFPRSGESLVVRYAKR